MSLLKTAKRAIILNWSTGITSGISVPYNTAGLEAVDFFISVPGTTTIVTCTVQGAATTTAGDFQSLSYNSTAISVASTVTGGCHHISISKPHPSYQYLKVSVNSTGTAAQGQVLAIGTAVRYAPTTSVTTEIPASFYAVSPTT